MKTNEMMLMDHIELLYEYPVVLFGAGSWGGDMAGILEEAEMQFYGFVDSDILKWGTKKGDKMIYSPLHLKEKCQKEKVIVIVSVGIRNVDNVLAVMEHLEIKPYIVATMYAIEYATYVHYDCGRFPKNFIEKQTIMHEICEERQIVENKYYQYKNIFDCNLVLRNKCPILVYQPGKVGSLSIFNTLVNLNMPVQHLHHMAAGDKTIILNNATETVRIIAGVRCPISRFVSNFFYHIRNGRTVWAGIGFDDSLKAGVVEAFLKYLKDNRYIMDEFAWYDNEMKKYCDIDVYEYPFDKEKGYTIIEKGKLKVFLYKMECLDKLETKLRDFVGNQAFTINHGNSINDSLGKYAYKEFKDAVRFPADIFWEYYNSEKMRHFYTDEEMEAMRNAWIDRLV